MRKRLELNERIMSTVITCTSIYRRGVSFVIGLNHKNKTLISPPFVRYFILGIIKYNHKEVIDISQITTEIDKFNVIIKYYQKNFEKFLGYMMDA